MNSKLSVRRPVISVKEARKIIGNESGQFNDSEIALLIENAEKLADYIWLFRDGSKNRRGKI